MIKTIFLLCLITLFIPNSYAEHRKYTIGFFNPHKDNTVFWSLLEMTMQSACNDLGMELKIYHSDHINQLNNLKRAIKNNEIDAAVFKTLKNNGIALLEVIEKHKIPSFFINVGLTPENLKRSGGGPRQKFKYWIGELLPNDEDAGYYLAEKLVQIAREKKMIDQDGKIHMVGISGLIGDNSSIKRVKGLKRFLNQPQNSDVILSQVVYSNWNKLDSKSKLLGLKKRYPKARVVWVANDPMALGTLEGIGELGLEIGKDMISAGIDWTYKGLESVSKNHLSFSLGGHYMEGGWSMAILYDYLHGVDFMKTEGVQMSSNFSILDNNNVHRYIERFGDNNWDQINYKLLSKKFNPDLLQYHFKMENIFKQLSEKKDKTK